MAERVEKSTKGSVAARTVPVAGCGQASIVKSAVSQQNKRIVDLRLADRMDELTSAMLGSDRFDAMGPHGEWLRDRYKELLPAVLPNTLWCMETGSKPDPSSLAAIRASAQAMRNSTVPLSMMLRGGVPALRVFSAFMHGRETGLSARDLTVLMGRAALIAGELGACWVEAWADARRASTAVDATTDGDSLDLVAVPGTVEQPALDMLALVAAGRSNEEIADATDYSVPAVKWHLARVMRTWKVDTRAALVSVALLRGVLVARRSVISQDDRPDASR